MSSGKFALGVTMEGGEYRNGGSGGTPSFTVRAEGGMV